MPFRASPGRGRHPRRRRGESLGGTRSFVNRLLRLTLLAPDIVEAILDGRQPKAMQLEDLTRPLPRDWEERRKRLLPPGAA